MKQIEDASLEPLQQCRNVIEKSLDNAERLLDEGEKIQAFLHESVMKYLTLSKEIVVYFGMPTSHVAEDRCLLVAC